MSLITEIQNDILNQSIPLSSILRKAKVLAYHLNNTEFKNWVEQELNGYTDNDTIPDYRKTYTQSFGDFLGPYARARRNAPISTLVFPQELKEFATTLIFIEGVRHLESLLENDSESFQYLWPQEIVTALQHLIYENMMCQRAWRLAPRNKIEQVLDSVRNRLLTFILELEQMQPDVDELLPDKQPVIPNEKITQMVTTHIYGDYNVNPGISFQGENMTVFDQRNQKVNYQYNAAGDINFDAVKNQMEVVVELEKLQIELIRAFEAGVFDEDIATDAEYQLKKAIQKAKKPEPDQKSVLEHLNEAKALLGGVAGAATLVTALVEAADKVQQFFQ